MGPPELDAIPVSISRYLLLMVDHSPLELNNVIPGLVPQDRDMKKDHKFA